MMLKNDAEIGISARFLISATRLQCGSYSDAEEAPIALWRCGLIKFPLTWPRGVSTMITILTISALSLFFLVLAAIYLRQRHPHIEENLSSFPRSHVRSLFSETAEATAHRLQAEAEARKLAQREALLARATQGDLAVLREATADPDAAFYQDTLNALVRVATGSPDATERLQAVVAQITQHKELRASADLAREMIARWQHAPDRKTLGAMLHIAALADDVAVYQQAVEVALRQWRGGSLTDVSASYLRALIESESWVIASAARKSGAGFPLQQTLSNVRQELAAANSRQQ